MPAFVVFLVKGDYMYLIYIRALVPIIRFIMRLVSGYLIHLKSSFQNLRTVRRLKHISSVLVKVSVKMVNVKVRLS